MNQRPPLDALVALALEAGREIMHVRSEGFEALKKGDGSPVTIADQRAEAIIQAGLATLCPGAPMIGEESVAAGIIPECGSFFFSVDPLDGTRDFVAGGDEFTVNIGLIENGAPTMGVVYAPASGELYAGEPGRALKDGAAIAAATSKPQNGWRVVASRHSGKNSATADFLAAIGPHSLCNGSSSIKFCRLAENEADLYPRFGEVNEWDAAAGHAILSAAGGGVMRLDGSPLIYGAPNGDFLVRGFIAFANAEAEAAARATFTR
ncbi:MAG: 3'(2'),5'-bisphosphate nucleotidase CysQ [Hyphomonadaceae bacterium]